MALDVSAITALIRNRVGEESTVRITDAEILKEINDGYKDITVKAYSTENIDTTIVKSGLHLYSWSGNKITKVLSADVSKSVVITPNPPVVITGITSLSNIIGDDGTYVLSMGGVLQAQPVNVTGVVLSTPVGDPGSYILNYDLTSVSGFGTTSYSGNYWTTSNGWNCVAQTIAHSFSPPLQIAVYGTDAGADAGKLTFGSHPRISGAIWKDFGAAYFDGDFEIEINSFWASRTSFSGGGEHVVWSLSNLIGPYDFEQEAGYDKGMRVTLTIASPCEVTPVYSFTEPYTEEHHLTAGMPVYFWTTGTLPTGITEGQVYYVIADGLTDTTFRFSASVGGPAVNTSGTQSGNHSITVFADTTGQASTLFGMTTTVNATYRTLNINPAPATSWEAGDVITGQTSGRTCTVIRKVDDNNYIVSPPSAPYSSGEIIGVTGVPAKLADQDADHPDVYSTSDLNLYVDGVKEDSILISSGISSVGSYYYYHWLTIKREEGTPSTLKIYVYSDAGRTSLITATSTNGNVGYLSANLASDDDFRYMYLLATNYYAGWQDGNTWGFSSTSVVARTISWGGGSATTISGDGTYSLSDGSGNSISAVITVGSLPSSDQTDTITILPTLAYDSGTAVTITGDGNFALTGATGVGITATCDLSAMTAAIGTTENITIARTMTNHKGALQISPTIVGRKDIDDYKPYYWFTWGGYIKIEPVPDDEYRVSLYIGDYPSAALVNSTDTPTDLPAEFWPCLVDYGCYTMCIKLRKWAKAILFYNSYIQGLNQRKHEYILRRVDRKAMHQLPYGVADAKESIINY